MIKKLKFSENISDIRVNDIFDDLIEENKRLLNQLLFANNCLNKIKIHLNLIYDKYEKYIDFEYKTQFQEINEEFKQLLETNETIEEKSDENQCLKSDENINELNEDSDESEEYLPKNKKRKNYRKKGNKKETKIFESNYENSLYKSRKKSDVVRHKCHQKTHSKEFISKRSLGFDP